MTLTDLIIKLSAEANAGQVKTAVVAVTTEDGREIHCQITGVYVHKMSPDKVFLAAKPITF